LQKNRAEKNYFLSVYHTPDITGTVKADDGTVFLHCPSPAEMEQMRTIPSVYETAKQPEEKMHRKDYIN